MPMSNHENRPKRSPEQPPPLPEKKKAIAAPAPSPDAKKIGAWRQKIEDLKKFKADIEIARAHLKAQNVDKELQRVDKEIDDLETKIGVATGDIEEVADEDIDDALSDEQILKEQAAKSEPEADFEIVEEGFEEPKVIVDAAKAPGAIVVPSRGRKTLRADIAVPEEVADEDIDEALSDEEILKGQAAKEDADETMSDEEILKEQSAKRAPKAGKETLKGITSDEVDAAFDKIESGTLVSVEGVRESSEDAAKRLNAEIAAEQAEASPFEQSLKATLAETDERKLRTERMAKIDPELEKTEKAMRRFEKQADNMEKRLLELESELDLTEEEYELRQVSWWGRRLNDILRLRKPEQFDQFVVLMGTLADKKGALLDAQTRYRDQLEEIENPEGAARKKKERERQSKEAYLRRHRGGGRSIGGGGGGGVGSIGPH